MSYSKTIPAKFPFGQRSFLKATFFDDEKQLLVSKSILRDDMPAVRHTSRALPRPVVHCSSCKAQAGMFQMVTSALPSERTTMSLASAAKDLRMSLICTASCCFMAAHEQNILMVVAPSRGQTAPQGRSTPLP